MWWAPERKGDDEGQVWGLREGRHGAACCYLHAQNSSSEMSAKSICWMCIRSVSLRSNHLETTRASHLYGSELGLLTRSYEQQRSCGCAREEVLAPGSGAMSGRLTLPRSPRSVLSAQGPTRGSRRGLRCSLGRGRGTKQSVRPARCTTEAVIAYPWTDVLSPVAQAPALLRSLSGQESSRWATHRTQRTQSSGPPRTLKVLRASAVCARGTPPGKTDSSCSRDLVWLRNFDWLISVNLSALERRGQELVVLHPCFHDYCHAAQLTIPPPLNSSSWMLSELLYLAHTLLELVLGLLKLRGRYHHEPPASKPPRSQMYTRHHGASLLSHALLGALVLWRGLVDTETGLITSLVLASFHGVTSHEPRLHAREYCAMVTVTPLPLNRRRRHTRIRPHVDARCNTYFKGHHPARAVCCALLRPRILLWCSECLSVGAVLWCGVVAQTFSEGTIMPSVASFTHRLYRSQRKSIFTFPRLSLPLSSDRVCLVLVRRPGRLCTGPSEPASMRLSGGHRSRRETTPTNPSHAHRVPTTP